MHGYGFWAGKEPTDICSELTNVPANHWHENSEECDILLQNHFSAFETGINMIIYVGGGIVVMGMSLCHCMFVRPFTKRKN